MTQEELHVEHKQVTRRHHNVQISEEERPYINRRINTIIWLSSSSKDGSQIRDLRDKLKQN